ncbi:MAG: Mannose-phosphate guanylyltransferase [Clostridiales bacterium]|jgi:mannose-1-phosphate guanylyltransferase|nr:Mannose-phosphate guanylyltransferase [Clostridiales bacterium]
MKALFLAGGIGTRLKPLTEDLPKPMVPMMVKPLLERNMLKLKDCGVDEIILSTCYKPQKIEEHFGDGTKLGLKIHYICEDIPLGTGGAIKNTEEFFNDTFIIFNADILSDINIIDMMKFHKEKCAAVTIAVTQVENPSAYGVIEYNENLYAESFTEKPKLSEIKSNFINAGIYIFEPNVLKEIPDSQVVSIERETFPLLLREGYPIAVYKSDAYWIDIGTIEKYIQAHEDMLSGACPLPEFKNEGQDIFIGENTIIHASTKIIGPAYIGENTVIGAFSTIGPYTIIGNNCRTGSNNRITNSIIWDKMSIQDNSTFSDIILDSKFTILKSIFNMNINETDILNKKIAL